MDVAGAKRPYADETTGKIWQAQVLAAILGWSQYTYVEAIRDQAVEEYIAGCENGLLCFSGVSATVGPNNFKSAVFNANRYEPDLNENFRAFEETLSQEKRKVHRR